MVTHYLPALAAAMIASVQLAGCSSVPAYSYYPVPCSPTAAAGASPAPNTASQTLPSASVPTSAPAVGAPGAPDAAGTAASPTANCVVAVPNYGYGYAGGYDPYWDYGWPYYGGIGVDAFVGDRFHHGFRDRGFHGRVHDHGFAGGLHARGLHAGGFHGGGGGHR
jgi:hypothetical protein